MRQCQNSILFVFILTDENVPWHCYVCNPAPLIQLKKDANKFLEGRSAATTERMPGTSRESDIHFASNERNETCSSEGGHAPSAEVKTSRITREGLQSKRRRHIEENNEKKRVKRSSICANKQGEEPDKIQNSVGSAKERLEVKLASATGSGVGDGSYIDPNCERGQPVVYLVDISKFYSFL